MYYIGLDTSISNTGICVLKDDEIVLSTSIPVSIDYFKFYDETNFMNTRAYELGLVTDNFKRSKKLKEYTKEELQYFKVPQQKRIGYICDALDTILKQFPCDETFAACENISIRSKGQVVDLARLLGGVEQVLRENGIHHTLFEPTKVKMMAGKGNFDKDQMIAAVNAEDLEVIKSTCPVDKKEQFVGLDDRVDAYWIAMLLRHTLS